MSAIDRRYDRIVGFGCPPVKAQYEPRSFTHGGRALTIVIRYSERQESTSSDPGWDCTKSERAKYLGYRRVSMDDATHHQTDKDDEAEWGTPEPARRSERRRLASLVSVRFSPGEEEVVRNAAAARGQSLSGFVRQAALREARPATTRQIGFPARSTTSAQTSTGYALGSVVIVGPDTGPITREAHSR